MMAKTGYAGIIIRLLMGLLLPVPMAILIVLVLGVFSGGEDVLKSVPAFVVFGYYFMAIPSLIYCLLMEFLVNRKIGKDAFVWVIGGLLGLLSGLMWGGFFLLIGFVVGFVCALLLRWHFKRQYGSTNAEPVEGS